MKQYSVKITQKALTDMEAVYCYIADSLHSPDIAMKQYNRIADAIESLASMPNRHPLFESKLEREQGMRRLQVDHYSAIYVSDEKNVTVLRVLYSPSDIISRLKER